MNLLSEWPCHLCWPAYNIQKNPQDKSKMQTETLAWKILVLFLIWPSPSSHTIRMTGSEVVWVSQMQPSITITPVCTIQGAWFRQLPLSLGMYLLLGLLRNWAYCQQLNNISISSPYKKYSQKSVHMEIVALVVTWKLSLQLRIKLNLPHSSVPQFPSLVLSVHLLGLGGQKRRDWFWCLMLPSVGLSQVESC